MSRRGLNIFVVVILATLVSSCISTHQSAFVGVPAMMWRRGGVEIVMNNGDTVSRRNIDIVTRYAPSMVRKMGVGSGSMLFDVTTITPDSLEITERVLIKNLDVSPMVLNGYREHTYHYRTNVVWRQMGEYRVVIEPSHDSQLITGLLDVGVNITPSQR